MQEVKSGQFVSVHYTGKLEDGTIFDSSLEREPLEFIVGAGSLILGFEQAVTGMKVGETKTATIPPGEAYGPYDQDQVIQVERSKMPADAELKVGQHIHLNHPDGRSVRLSIIDVSDESVTLDANHPLAGKTLLFEIRVLAIG
jgi:peptidylprolyl isomerase